MPFYLAKMIILIGWSQKFLIREKEQGIWWRSGLLFIATSPYVMQSLFRAALGKDLDRSKFVTKKGKSTEVESYLPFFKIHIILACVNLLVYALSLSGIMTSIVGQEVQIFLIMNVVVWGGLALTATKWFQKIILNVKEWFKELFQKD